MQDEPESSSARRFLPEQSYRPKRLPRSFWGWILPTLRASEEEVILVAGVDAAMYLRIMKFGRRCLSGHSEAALQATPVSTGLYGGVGASSELAAEHDV